MKLISRIIKFVFNKEQEYEVRCGRLSDSELREIYGLPTIRSITTKIPSPEKQNKAKGKPSKAKEKAKQPKKVQGAWAKSTKAVPKKANRLPGSIKSRNAKAKPPTKQNPGRTKV